MAKTLARPQLHVEGIDDQHSLVNLLMRNGVGYVPGDVKLVKAPPELPEFLPARGVETLIDLVETAVMTSTGRPVGFVLDADSPMVDRWRQMQARLNNVGVDAPADRPPTEGFLGTSTKYQTKVGVWVMPDNERDGKLENFLTDLIAPDDVLIDHVRKATAEARSLGAAFSDPDVVKAEVHAWLAWQEEPGKPYGQAVMAKYFQHDSPAATRFVAWFRRLYDLGG